MCIRKGWLDALNLEVPQTYDELSNVLAAFRDHYGCLDAMLLSSKFCGEHDALCGGYGLNMLRGNIGSLAFEAVDGKAQGFITYYLEVGPFNTTNFVADDNCGVWVSGNTCFADSWAKAYYTGQYMTIRLFLWQMLQKPLERLLK